MTIMEIISAITAVAVVASVVVTGRGNTMIKRLGKDVDALQKDVAILSVRSICIPKGHKLHTIPDESGPGAWAASKSPDGTIVRHHYFRNGIPKGMLMASVEDEV